MYDLPLFFIFMLLEVHLYLCYELSFSSSGLCVFMSDDNVMIHKRSSKLRGICENRVFRTLGDCTLINMIDVTFYQDQSILKLPFIKICSRFMTIELAEPASTFSMVNHSSLNLKHNSSIPDKL